MDRIKTLRSALAGVLAGTVVFSAAAPAGTYIRQDTAVALDPVPYYYHGTFEEDTDGWTGRGGASVDLSDNAYLGEKALTVTGRSSAWNGAQKALSGATFNAGTAYSFNAAVSGSGTMMLSLQYTDASGKTVYDHIASGRATGDYIMLTNTAYTFPEGSDFILYIETEDGTADFTIDEVTIAAEGTRAEAPYKTIIGDFNGDERVDTFDLIAARKALLSYTGGSTAGISMDIADVDGDGEFAVNDLVVLAKFVLGQTNSFPRETMTTTTTATTAPATTTTTPANTDYMASIRDKVTASVPASAMQKAEGTVEHITYFSKKANRNKGANVWLPPNYDASSQYPVFYVNHGYGGDESSMLNGMGIREIATTLIKSGEAVPMIIVFTNQYTDPQHEKQTGNGQADVPGYDNFVEDLPDSLMPYIESHYPVKTGRENTAIAGFSMGGREALYIGMKCCDKIGYIGGGAPAPGIFPTRDQFMDHPGVMSKDEIRIDPPYSPYLLMIAGGTNDGMVGDYPKQYSDLFTQHGTENIFLSVPGGGHDSSTVTPLMYNFIRFIFKA
ncbi:MAG: alpha/beta hydrolase-fold protein [Ruminococcus sp.]|nr:alpha/beta hydrolase-fold protein [Ruminococcus sp.]